MHLIHYTSLDGLIYIFNSMLKYFFILLVLPFIFVSCSENSSWVQKIENYTWNSGYITSTWSSWSEVNPINIPKYSSQKFWDTVLVARYIRTETWSNYKNERYFIYGFDWLHLEWKFSQLRQSPDKLIFKKNSRGSYTLSGSIDGWYFHVFHKTKEQDIINALKEVIIMGGKSPENCSFSTGSLYFPYNSSSLYFPYNSWSISLRIFPVKEYYPSKQEILRYLQKNDYSWSTFDEIEEKLKYSPAGGFAEEELRTQKSIDICGDFSETYFYHATGIFVYNPETAPEYFLYFDAWNGGWGVWDLGGTLQFIK